MGSKVSQFQVRMEEYIYEYCIIGMNRIRERDRKKIERDKSNQSEVGR